MVAELEPARPAAGTGQLTYTSYQPDTGPLPADRGGWQVKQQTRLAAAERAAVDALLVTSLGGAPASRFPTPAEIAARPRRLRYELDGGIAVCCLSVNAGPDDTGRPDNVFNHAVVGVTAARPIELWGSPRWLTPYGPDEVRAAVFAPDRPPEPAGVLDRPAVLRFLFDPEHYRFSTLAFLLDAVAAAVAGGARVVLPAGDVEGAHWIAAVGAFTSAAAARRVTFSSYERLAGPDTAAPLLAVVPPAEVVGTDRVPAGVVLVDPAAEPDLLAEDGGDRWVNGLGHTVPVTDWSRLALDVCAHGAEVLAEVLATADAASAGEPWHPGGILAWPLAVAAGEHPALATAEPLAGRVVVAAVSRLPAPLPAALERAARRTEIRARTAAEAWDILGQAVGDQHDRTGLVVLVYTRYVELAAADPDWLAGPEPAPLPATALPADALLPLHRVLAGLAAREAAAPPVDDPRQLVYRARLLDFAVRVLNPPRPVAELTALAAAVAAGLPGRHGAAAAGWIKPVTTTTVHDYLGPALRTLAGVPGDRLPGPVLGWLAPAYRRSVEELSRKHLHEQWGAAGEDVLVWRCRHDPGFAAGRRVDAAVLVMNGYGPGGPVLAEILGGVGGAPSWSPKELADLAAAAPASRLEEVRDLVTEFVFAHPEVTEARHLVATAMVSRWARSRRGVAGLPAPLTIYRLLAPRWYLASNGFPAVAAEIAMLAEQWWPACRPHQRRVLAPHVLLATVQAELALVADAIGPTGPCHRPTLRLRDRLRELDPPLVQPDLVELGLAGAVPLAAEVMRRHGCLRDLLVHDGVSEFRNVRHGFLRRPLPPPQAAAAGAADITQLLLRAAYAEYDRREVLKVGRELREQYLPVPAAGEAFLAWWEGVLPAAGALARATEAARNVVRRKESR